jgi:hypothetical protein
MTLSQVRPIGEADKDKREAIADWHYWVVQGCRLWADVSPGVLEATGLGVEEGPDVAVTETDDGAKAPASRRGPRAFILENGR